MRDRYDSAHWDITQLLFGHIRAILLTLVVFVTAIYYLSDSQSFAWEC